jgi:hypothetical protein
MRAYVPMSRTGRWVEPNRLRDSSRTNISLIMFPSDSLTISPTNIPGNIDTGVS